MDVGDDIEFIKKLQSIQEHRRAVSLCQYLLGLPSVINGVRQKIDVGNLLATSLIALDEENSIEEAEYDSLVQIMLSLGKRKQAAHWLFRKACNSGLAKDFVRVADLFSKNTDPEILRIVNEAFEVIFEFNQEEFTPEVEDLCNHYKDFLFSNDIPCEVIEKFLENFWSSPCVDEHRFLSILLDFIDSRDEVTPRITYLLARCYGYLGKYEDALKTLLPLLVGDVGENRIYMLSYAGEWFFELNRPENALLFLKGAIEAPDSIDHKLVVEKAAQIIKTIEDVVVTQQAEHSP